MVEEDLLWLLVSSEPPPVHASMQPYSVSWHPQMTSRLICCYGSFALMRLLTATYSCESLAFLQKWDKVERNGNGRTKTDLYKFRVFLGVEVRCIFFCKKNQPN